MNSTTPLNRFVDLVAQALANRVRRVMEAQGPPDPSPGHGPPEKREPPRGVGGNGSIPSRPGEISDG
jgi:hypothetical protein